MGLLGIPFGDLLLQLLAASLQAVAGIDHVADFGFQAADLRIGLVQLSLGGVDRVAGRVVGLPARFEFGFAGTQAGDSGFQVVLGLSHVLVFALALRSEEHTSELQSLIRNSFAVFWLKTNKMMQ